MGSYKFTLLRLGEWQVHLVAHSPDIQSSLQNIQDHYPQFFDKSANFDNSIGQLFIMSATELKNANIPSWTYTGKTSVFPQFFADLMMAYRQYSLAHSRGLITAGGDKGLFSFSWSQYINNGEMLPNTKVVSGDLHALVVGTVNEHTYIRILLYLLFTATCWHINQGGLLLHSSAVLHHSLDKGFLFLGESGKGKTTVAQLSVETGHIALGDDLNFIIQVRPNDYKLGVAPSIVPTLSSYSMLNPSLRGIFKLTKDNHDELIQLSPRNIAKNLLESLKQIPKAASLSDQIFQNAFQTISSIARAVPGYELHFRKSPDFWKLIDERFPD